MPNTPSSGEIAFARKRFELGRLLVPYFVEKFTLGNHQPIHLNGDFATTDGRSIREDTIKGQSLIWSARFKDADDVFDERIHQVTLTIQHTAEWLPAITIHSDLCGPVPTTIITGEVEVAIPSLKKLIDAAFNIAR